MHLVLQYYNYEGNKDLENLDQEIDQLVELGEAEFFNGSIFV